MWGGWLQATGLFIHPSKEGGGKRGGVAVVGRSKPVGWGGVVDEVVVVRVSSGGRGGDWCKMWRNKLGGW